MIGTTILKWIILPFIIASTALRQVGAKIQNKPLRISKDVTVMGTTYVTAKDSNSVRVKVPKDADPGDILVMFIGGSASGNKRPSDPGKGWEEIFEIGKEDLNLKAFWKVYDGSDDMQVVETSNGYDIRDNIFEENWKIDDGKNTFVALVSVRGIDDRKPVVDADAGEDTLSGRDGKAKAPSIRAEKGGIVLACFVYDDPHVATVTNKGYDMLLSSDTGGGDGMAIAVAPTSKNDKTGSIYAEGRGEEKGGGDDIGMSISFRVNDSPPPPPPPPPPKSPTPAPTVMPPTREKKKRLCNKSEERTCKKACFIADGCGKNPFSPCHRICRYKCCERKEEDKRSCFTSEEKLCRETCSVERDCGLDDVCTKVCRRECCHDDERLKGSIMIPERRRNTLFMFSGSEQNGEVELDEDESLWSMRLYPNNLWTGSNSINDVKRIIHKDRVHMIVCGNGGDVVAMYDFETQELIYWSRTCGSGPHDVEYIPLRGGYLAVANARGSDSHIELYDLNGPNNNKCIRPKKDHNGVHSVLWDGKQKRVWAWGASNVGLVSYKVDFESDAPLLVKDQEFQADITGFDVGVGHGASPMVTADGRRLLLLAGKSGILQFDTESHQWSVVKWASGNEGDYSNPKSISYNMQTGEIILTQSNSKIYSLTGGILQLPDSDIYKATWWQDNGFSNYEEPAKPDVYDGPIGVEDASAALSSDAVEYYTAQSSAVPSSISASDPELYTNVPSTESTMTSPSNVPRTDVSSHPPSASPSI